MRLIVNIIFFSFLISLHRDTISFISANPFSFKDIISSLDSQQEHEIFGYLTIPESANDNDKVPLVHLP